MIRLIQRRLIIPRGDTGTLSIPVLAGKNVGDVPIFTIFNTLTHRKVFEKTMEMVDSTLTIEFKHGDTVNLPVGQYVWDIKFYTNPVFADEKLISGTEVDSYYAAFNLPICEIRETGDNLLMADDAPTSTLRPDQINLIDAAITDINASKSAAALSETNAATSASNASTSELNVEQYAAGALLSKNRAIEAESNANASATAAALSAQQAAATAQAIHEEIPTKVSDLIDDSGHYTKPAGGIPASDLAETYLTQHQDISGKANSADLAAVATSGSYNDLSDKPTIPDIQIDSTSIVENGVANIPVASSNVLGVVGVNSQQGITLGSGNNLEIHPASNAEIKSGNQYLKAIVPSRQENAVFYGLAKAAGADESASQEAMGTYREPAKAAIRNMIGAAAITDIPTKVSDLQDDSGHYTKPANGIPASDLEETYLTQHQDISGKANSADLATVATSGDYDDLINKPTIPEVPVQDVQVNGSSILNNNIANVPIAGKNEYGVIKIKNADVNEAISNGGSVLINGALYYVGSSTPYSFRAGVDQAALVSTAYQHWSAFYGLAKAAGVSETGSEVGTYSANAKAAIQSMLDVPSTSAVTSEIATAIGNINSFDMAVVQELPSSDISTHTIYLVSKTGETNDVYDEYVYINNAWEMVGNTQIDLSNYVQFTDYATTETAGIIKYNPNAFTIDASGVLSIQGGTREQYKAGVSGQTPVMISGQGTSVFYGLAKAAGDTTQKNSSNAVGTYTTEAKAAIRSMLDVPATSDIPSVPVQDVQINSSSILDANGVANIPIANTSTAGVIKVGDGLAIVSGALVPNFIGEANIKKGTISAGVISSARQHIATFYGLAKAAGDTTQSQSANAVGTYTTSAKSAIQTMLGIKYTLTVTVLTQDNVTVTNQTVTLREGGPTGQIYATATYSGQPVSFALPTGFSYYVSVSDTLAHHFNPTTASGIITDADAAATLTYSDFSSIQTAADIKAALNAGLDLTDLVGEQISCTWNNSTLVWDVVDYSNDTITLLTHDTLPTQLVFEPVQALMWCENGLAAGSYSFIDGSSTYYFTLTTAIPSGGQLRATTSAFQTYASMEATATLETGTVSTTEISGATSLGTTATGNLNHMSRVNYGSNNYKESALFQWLNSTEAANTPMPRITKFSRPCTYSVPGFLGALDSSFVAAIDDTTWLCSTNNTYECPTSLGGTVAKSNAYTVTAKIGLASEMEIFGSYGGTADGSTVFDLFNGATADDRKKYQPGTSTSRYWWLRSPHWGSADRERSVNSSGTAGNYGAYYSSGVVPAVKISKTVASE